MVKDLERIEKFIFELNGHAIKSINKEQECEEYFGLNFRIDKLNIKFRKAKITPKKSGQFLTLWKRNAEKQTEPFNLDDDFDFYIVVAEQENKFGFFLFPKTILSEKQILTKDLQKGKRGFRVYPEWTKTDNKQAEKTQSWQTKYFIDLTNKNNEIKYIEKFRSIITQ